MNSYSNIYVFVLLLCILIFNVYVFLLPRIMKHYSPIGGRNRGRPQKRLLDT